MKRPGLALKLSVLLVLGVVGGMVADFALSPPDDIEDGRARAAIFVAFAVSMAFSAALVLDALVVRPLVTLARHADHLWASQFADPVPNVGTDEPRELALALEALRQQVVADRQALQALNRELEARVLDRSQQLVQAREEIVARERLAAVGRLAAGVAHEVNNPAAVILGRATLLLDDAATLPTDTVADLQVIARQAQRIRDITGALLRLGRPQSGVRAPLDLAEVVLGSVALVQREADRAGVSLVVEVEPSPALGDSAALDQLLHNLLRNSLAAAPGGTIWVRAAPGEIRVDDTGPGFSPEVLPRLFEPFFTTKPVGEGTGLGLAICRGIAEEHGGTLTAENRAEGGARMRLRLPTGEPAPRPS
ncbi:MAG: HAMP domain-containing histidine kinase [Deltaproteobacteria bacterium]|nr:HAMP domain-containing histidine kinase [Deltaproteobacteria bacterium]